MTELNDATPQGAEEQYLAMLQAIKTCGVYKGDRTGTGTQDLFGYQLRMDLSKGFPLLTTKKMFTRGIFEELLWFMRGETNVAPLKEQKVGIWDSWHDEFGSIGPGYGKQWRRWESNEFVVPRVFEVPARPPETEGVAGVGTGGENRHGNWALYQIWAGMLYRCYDNSRSEYSLYGGRGVHVCERWLNFNNFLEDAPKLPGWHLKSAFWHEYSLDKDYYCSNRYGPDTCRWLSPKEQRINTGRNEELVVVEMPDGTSFTTMDVPSLCQDYRLDKSSVYKCLRGDKESYMGIRFSRVLNPEGTVARCRIIDQLSEVLAALRQNPFSRRIILNAWNAPELPRMKLPPCHVMAQFSVRPHRDDITKPHYLDCQLYQRSSDVFLGVPFNIASYALLTHIMAGLSGLEPGVFVHTFGSVHIYNNHREQVDLQLTRKPYPLPTLRIRTFDVQPRGYERPLPTHWSIDEFLEYCAGSEDFVVENYQHHPRIKAEVSV